LPKGHGDVRLLNVNRLPQVDRDSRLPHLQHLADARGVSEAIGCGHGGASGAETLESPFLGGNRLWWLVGEIEFWALLIIAPRGTAWLFMVAVRGTGERTARLVRALERKDKEENHNAKAK